MRLIVFFLFSFCATVDIYSQEWAETFPTGMKWTETIVEPGQPIDLSTAVNFEIGRDTLIDGRNYRQVYKEGLCQEYWLREDNGEVWLLAKQYGMELKLYDFNWQGGSPIQQEYLIEGDGGLTLEKEEFIPNEASKVTYFSNTYPYYQQSDYSIICGLGRVADLNRNACLLGFKKTSTPLPGILYNKVLCISIGGNIIFESTSSEEWTISAVDKIKISSFSEKPVMKQSHWYDLQGRRLTTPPSRGCYISGGRKIIVM